MSLMKVCSCLCCCFIITVNIVAILIGIILTLLGCLFTWGFAAFSAAIAGFLSGPMDSISQLLRDNLGVDIDLPGLLGGLSQITGSMGAGLLILGVCLLVLGCVGCCGACCSSRGCLLVYAIIVAVFVLAQSCIVTIWFVNADLIKQLAKLAMIDSVKQFTGISSKNIQSLVQNVVHIFVGCCGVTNGSDFHELSPNWQRAYTFNRSGYNFEYNLTYPLTCCKFNMTSISQVDEWCSYNNTNVNTSWYQTGCYDKVFQQIDGYFQLSHIFYTLGGIIGLQALLGLGAGVMMANIAAKNKVKPV